MMDGLIFLRPLWLLALLPLPALLLWLWRRPATTSPWTRAVDAHLLPHLLAGRDPKAGRRPHILLGLAWLLGVLALAGPSWQRLPPLQYRPNVPPLMIALDLSRSMTTRDLTPSRLAVARAKLQQLLKRLPQRPVALVVFSATAHRSMPFTEDRQLIGDTLSRMTPDLMPAQGSRASAALTLAQGLFSGYQARGGDLLLVTDAADPAAESMARRLYDQGRKVSVLALGTPTGGPVPDGDGGYLRGESGPVTASVNLESLRRLAEAGGGVFTPAAANDSDIDSLLQGFGQPRAAGGASRPGEGEIRHDGGPWLLPPLLLLCLWLFRRGSTLVLLLALGLSDRPALALQWDELWLNSNQRALRALRDGWPRRAVSGFSDPLWQGVALYRGGEYPAALARFERVPGAIGHYNRGNTLVQLGRLDEASAAYREALRLDPALEDASHNLGLVRRALETGGPTPPIEATRDAATPSVIEKKPKAQAALSAEELLDAPLEKDFEQPWGNTERDLQGIGSVGGGAMMIKGGDHPEVDESTSIGQGMEEGEAETSGEDRVVRRGGSSEFGRGDSAAEKTAPSHLPQPDQAPSPAQEPTGGAPVLPATDDPDSRDIRERMERSMSRGADPAPPTGSGEQRGPGAAEREALQALRHWIDGIEDDPSGLLKEKFRREYRRRTEGTPPGDPW